MKNIVLVTWIGGGNYGTSLQSFALHRKLADLGYKTSIVIPFFPIKYNLKSILVRILTMLGLSKDKLKILIKGDMRNIKQKKLDKFENKYYNKRIVCFPFQPQIRNRPHKMTQRSKR